MNDSHPAEYTKEAQRFRQSFGRCCLDDAFLDTFYDLFINSSPAVRDAFSTTDMARQKLMVKSSLTILVMSASDSEFAKTLVVSLAERHSSRDLNIQPHLYELWLESLLEAIRRHDPEWTSEVEVGWRTFLTQQVAFMKANY